MIQTIRTSISVTFPDVSLTLHQISELFDLVIYFFPVCNFHDLSLIKDKPAYVQNTADVDNTISTFINHVNILKGVG